MDNGHTKSANQYIYRKIIRGYNLQKKYLVTGFTILYYDVDKIEHHFLQTQTEKIFFKPEVNLMSAISWVTKKYTSPSPFPENTSQ